MNNVESLGFDMSIASKHLPILVSRDKGNLLNREASFEESARTFVAKIVKMKVLYLQVFALATKRRAD